MPNGFPPPGGFGPGGFGGPFGPPGPFDPRNLPGPRDYYFSADGRVFTNPYDAIAASLGFEDISGTGAGCSQDPRNLPPKR